VNENENSILSFRSERLVGKMGDKEMDEETLTEVLDYLERLDNDGHTLRDAITVLELELSKLRKGE